MPKAADRNSGALTSPVTALPHSAADAAWSHGIVPPSQQYRQAELAPNILSYVTTVLEKTIPKGAEHLHAVLKNIHDQHPSYLPMAVVSVMRDRETTPAAREVLMTALRTPRYPGTEELYGAAYGTAVVDSNRPQGAQFHYIYDMQVALEIPVTTICAAALEILKKSNDPFVAASAAQLVVHDNRARTQFLVQAFATWDSVTEISQNAVLSAVCYGEYPALLDMESAIALLECCTRGAGVPALRLLGVLETNLKAFGRAINKLSQKHRDPMVASGASAIVENTSNPELSAVAMIRRTILSNGTFDTPEMIEAVTVIANASSKESLERLLVTPVSTRMAFVRNLTQLTPVFTSCGEAGLKALVRLLSETVSPQALRPGITEVISAFPPSIAIPFLAGMAWDDDIRRSEWAVDWLGRFLPHSEGVLTELLSSASDSVKVGALSLDLQALSAKPDGAEAIKAAVRLAVAGIGHENSRVRESASELLMSIPPHVLALVQDEVAKAWKGADRSVKREFAHLFPPRGVGRIVAAIRSLISVT